MSASFARPALRKATFAVAGAGFAYSSYSLYQSNSSRAFAESAPGPKKAFAGSGFVELKLESAELVNHNVKKLRFALSEPDTVSGLAPITSLLSKHTPDGAWLPVIRPYTPTIPDEPGHVTFMIKKYPNGKGSGKMHSLVPGDSMSFKTLHEFDYKPNQYTAMAFIAGGAGITPIYQLTRAILRNPADTTKITLVYANNTPSDILLMHEFDQLSLEFPERFHVSYVVSKTTPAEDAAEDGHHHYEHGYITKDLLNNVMPHPKTDDRVKVLVSGPPPMTAAIAGPKGGFGWTQGSLGGILKELGYQKAEVHKF